MEKQGKIVCEGCKKGFDEADANHDGKIDKSEFGCLMKKMIEMEECCKKATEMFEAIDTNHDGKITFEEMKAYMEK